uniref:Uncharacterized protein n=1 Tax=Candidatus Kentrum sp. DK TaxID=2126562 RepID=A0A450T9I0_9GAMM|nr:MAG: hypothetical protein BECKDK2373B_GA0170837_11251 [Candidatus Kentron sp. DK]
MKNAKSSLAKNRKIYCYTGIKLVSVQGLGKQLRFLFFSANLCVLKRLCGCNLFFFNRRGASVRRDSQRKNFLIRFLSSRNRKPGKHNYLLMPPVRPKTFTKNKKWPDSSTNDGEIGIPRVRNLCFRPHCAQKPQSGSCLYDANFPTASRIALSGQGERQPRIPNRATAEFALFFAGRLLTPVYSCSAHLYQDGGKVRPGLFAHGIEKA